MGKKIFSGQQQAAGGSAVKRARSINSLSSYLVEGTTNSKGWEKTLGYRSCYRQRNQAKELQKGGNCLSVLSPLVTSLSPHSTAFFSPLTHLTPHSKSLLNSCFCFVCFCLYLKACGSLVYQPGLEPPHTHPPPHGSSESYSLDHHRKSLNSWLLRCLPSF